MDLCFLETLTYDLFYLCRTVRQPQEDTSSSMTRLWTAALLAVTPRVQSFTYHSFRPFTVSTTALDDMSKKVLVPIGDGSEEIETTCITDTLTRCGAQVTVASVMPGQLTCKMSRGIKVTADMSIEDAAKEEWDLVALPGGMPGANHLRDSEILKGLLQTQKSTGKKYAAICAAPAVVLAEHGLLEDGSTCYPAPAFREKLTNPSDDAVVTKGSLTTSKGPGTALAFALELGEQLFGKEVRDKIQKEMLL